MADNKTRVPGRRGRVVFAGASSVVFSALFIAPPALLPGAEVTPLLVFVGAALPAGVAALTLALTEHRVERDLRPAQRHAQTAPVPAELREAVGAR